MSGDDLNTPLGMEPSRRRAPRRGAIVTVCAGGVLVALCGLGAVLLSANPRGGEPFAVATIAPSPRAAPLTEDRLATGSIRAPVQGADGGPSMENGVAVFRANKPAAHDGPLVIKVPEVLGQNDVSDVDKRLVETGRYGPLPKIGADGARPSDVYARPPVFGPAIRPGAPRIAIFIGGVGLSQAATSAAIDRMPAAVTLAFAPYGNGLDEAVRRAKGAGHEVMLQLPMEAFGDGQAQPGPHTLMAGARGAETIDDLHWLLSRMTGYVGVTNFLGGKFTADPAAMTGILQEIGSRGLIYVDDGTSKRSVAPSLSASLGVTASRADVVLDAAADPAALRSALVKLEALARDKGSAVGTASDLPANLAIIAQFAEALEAKGIALVPVSTLVGAAAPAVTASP